MFSKRQNRNKIIFLERRLAFIEEKLKSYENAKGPIINILPVKIYDMVPLNDQDFYNEKDVFFLIVLIIRKNDKRCPIVKISEKVLKDILISEDNITIYDYIHTEMFAEKTIDNDEWIWNVVK